MLAMLLVVLVVVVLLWAVLSFDSQFWFSVVFWLGVWFEVEEDLASET